MTQPGDIGALPRGTTVLDVLSRSPRGLVLRVRVEGEPTDQVLRVGAPEVLREAALFEVVSREDWAAPTAWGLTPDGRGWVRRPWIVGRPFDEAAREAPPGQVAGWIASLLGTLATLHDAGLVHRDVAAGNVLVTEPPDERAVLLDLDLVAAQGEGGAGSPWHLAPETMLGHPAGPAGDVYALGVMVALAYAGRPPPERQGRVPWDGFWRASELDPDRVPAELAPLVDALLATDPLERPDARSALARCARGEAARPPLAMPPLAGREDARRLLLETAAAAARGEVVLVECADPDEIEARADDLRRALAMGGARLAGAPEAAAWLADDEALARADATLVVSSLDGLALPDLVELAVGVRAHAGPPSVLVVDRGEAEAIVRRPRALDLDGRLIPVRWPGVEEPAIARHLEAITGQASPDLTRRLASHLAGLAGGRRAVVDARLRHAVEDGVLRPADGGYLPLRADWPLAPGDERARRPLAAQDETTRALVAACAVLGRAAPASAVIEVADVDEAAGRRALARLRAERAVERRRAGIALVEPGWRAQALADADGAAFHTRAAALAEREGWPLERLWRHRVASRDDAPSAARWLDAMEDDVAARRPDVAREVARTLAARGAAPERVDLLLARLDLAQGDAADAWARLRARFGPGLDDGRDAPSGEVAALAARAAQQLGRRREARALYGRLRELAEAGTGSRARALRLEAWTGLGYAAFLEGDHGRARDLVTDRIEPGDPPDAAATLLNLLASARMRLGDPAGAGRALDEARARAPTDPVVRARVGLNQGQLDRRRGRHADALAALVEAERAFAEAGHVPGRAQAVNNRAVVHRDLGELTVARALLERALALRRRVGDRHGAASSRANLGLVELEAGRVARARAMLADAREELVQGGFGGEAALVGLHGALALGLLGRRDEARAELDASAPDAHAAVRARVVATLALLADADDADALASEALARAAAAGDLAEQMRAAAVGAVAAPDDPVAREALRDCADGLGSASRRDEAAWRIAASGGRAAAASPERLLAWLASFETHGRCDLALAVLERIVRHAERHGPPEPRRRHRARLARLEEAVAGSASEDTAARELVARVERLAGHVAEEDGTGPGGLDLRWFLECNRRMAREEDLQGLLLAIVDMALELTGARGGLLVLLRDGEAEVEVARRPDGVALAPDEARFSRTVVQEAAATGAPVVCTDALRDERFAGTASIASFALRSVLCVPVSTGEGVIGALHLDDDRRAALFDATDVERVASLADQAAIAIVNLRRRTELEGARERLAERVAFQGDELERARRALRRQGRAAPVGGLVGEAPAMQDLYRLIDRLAPSDLAVLVTGPSGSGKELVARALHERSARADRALVVVNASALPGQLLESELFGHVRGAFTGADRDRPGLFQEADGGTFFLDEIGDLPLELQPKLLRVLESGEVRAVGGRSPVRVDVRLVAATHRDLRAAVEEGAFRADLFYRLGAAELAVPSLAERLDDVPLLVAHFLERLAQRHGVAKPIDPSVVRALVRRPWPGEVRELANEVARLYHLSDDAITDVGLVRRVEAPAASPAAASLRLEDVEREAIRRALEAAGGRRDRAAELLGISRAGLYTKMRRLGVDPSDETGT